MTRSSWATPQPAQKVSLEALGGSRLVVQGPKASAGARKEAIVAAARQLAVGLWRLFTGQITAQKLGLIYLPEAS